MFFAVAAAFLPEPVFPEFFSEQAEGNKEETTHDDGMKLLQFTTDPKDATGTPKTWTNQVPRTDCSLPITHHMIFFSCSAQFLNFSTFSIFPCSGLPRVI